MIFTAKARLYSPQSPSLLKEEFRKNKSKQNKSKKKKKSREGFEQKNILYFASCSEEEISKKTNHRVHAREQAKALSIHAKLHILFHAFPIQHIKSTILPVIWLTVFDCVWRTTYRTSTG